MLYEMSAPTATTAQFNFHAMVLLSRKAGKKILTVIQNAVNICLQTWWLSLGGLFGTSA